MADTTTTTPTYWGIERARGHVYFASGHSSPVYQGIPGVSNTESLSDSSLRDLLIDPSR